MPIFQFQGTAHQPPPRSRPGRRKRRDTRHRDKQGKPYQAPVTIPVTPLVRRLIREGKKTLMIYLSIPPEKEGTVQFLGPQILRTHPLAKLVYYERFTPRLEIRYRRRPGTDLNPPWEPFAR